MSVAAPGITVAMDAVSTGNLPRTAPPAWARAAVMENKQRIWALGTRPWLVGRTVGYCGLAVGWN
jgi:hypothetical protein